MPSRREKCAIFSPLLLRLNSKLPFSFLYVSIHPSVRLSIQLKAQSLDNHDDIEHMREEAAELVRLFGGIEAAGGDYEKRATCGTEISNRHVQHYSPGLIAASQRHAVVALRALATAGRANVKVGGWGEGEGGNIVGGFRFLGASGASLFRIHPSTPSPHAPSNCFPDQPPPFETDR